MSTDLMGWCDLCSANQLIRQLVRIRSIADRKMNREQIAALSDYLTERLRRVPGSNAGNEILDESLPGAGGNPFIDRVVCEDLSAVF